MGERDVGRLYWAARAVAEPAYRLLYRVRVEGIENVPAAGPAIIAANHISFFDSVVLMLSLPRRMSFVGKAEYLEDWKTKWLFPAIGMIPIERSAGRQARVALEAAAGSLRRGELFGIYPEGTRSRDGHLHKGHTGVAHLAIETGAPIVPVGLVGTGAIQPPDRAVPRLFMPAVVRFGEPLDPADYRLGRKARRQRMTDDLMAAIQELCGQPPAAGFAAGEPPLIRAGTESVYLVVSLAGSSPTSWEAATESAVAEVCRTYTDARVGKVHSLTSAVDESGRFLHQVCVDVSIKLRDQPGWSPKGRRIHGRLGQRLQRRRAHRFEQRVVGDRR